MSTFCHSTLPATTSNVYKSRNVTLLFLSAPKIRWTLDFSIPISRKHCVNDFFGDVQKPAWLHQHSSYKWNSSFFRTDLSTLRTVHRLQTFLGFLLLLPCWWWYTNSTLQRRWTSTLTNFTSVTTYVHRMIISPSCLFKYMKNDERVAMLFQCLQDHKQQKYCISASFLCWKITY